MARLSREQVDVARSAIATGGGLPEAISKEFVGIRDVLEIGGQIRNALAAPDRISSRYSTIRE